ncbi:MAG: OmpA family protein [Gammaproteobacteria bacterium]|nr:OmpA family protein [Gammaproteobacteria bacterium]
MNKNFFAISSVVALLLGSSAAMADGHIIPVDGSGGYAGSGAGSNVVMSGTGDCLRVGSFSDDNKIGKCEGEEEPKEEPVVEAEPEPAPKAEPVITTATLGGEALFATNSADLNAAGEEAMADLLAQLEKFEEITSIFIVGHTDSTGSESYNQSLSEQRADTIKGYLQAAYPNVPMQSSGAGETDPVATNSTAEGRQLNRRVEVTVAAKSITQS